MSPSLTTNQWVCRTENRFPVGGTSKKREAQVTRPPQLARREVAGDGR
jgi:hypothetical protein